MGEYQLTKTDIIIRTEDSASIPPDPDNMDYRTYLAWLDDGNEPDPYIEPEPDPVTFSADYRLTAGVASALTTAVAAYQAMQSIPSTGPVPVRFNAMLTQATILAQAFVAMLEAHADTHPDV